MKFGGGMEANRAAASWREYAILLAVYAAIRLPDVWVIDHFTTLIFPLNFFYFAKLLFSGIGVNPAIADTVIAPANASLIYPPGIYALSSLLGSVRNAFYFLFAIQALVPLLVFRLLYSVAPRLFAFSAAILVAFYCTSARSWYPDYIIQPLMAGILVFMLRDSPLRPLQLVVCGLAGGLIVVFKHNIGIFFAVLCGTLIFFRSCSFSAARAESRLPAYFLLSGFFAFGVVFLARLPHWDETVFYLVPYFAFWGRIAYLFHKGGLHLDSTEFARLGFLYGVSTLVLPVFVFVQFGEVIGFKRYWHSLFGMGFEHIALWDKGIWQIARAYSNFSGFWASYNSAVLLAALVGPFFINLAAVGTLFGAGAEDDQRRLQRIAAVSVGVMAVFMLFPLEDHKIAVAKSFVFIYVLAALLRNATSRSWSVLGVAALVMLLPVAATTWRGLKTMTGVPAVAGTSPLQKVIGLPVHTDIARELEAQVTVLRRATRGEAYFVLTSPTYNLLTLPILVDNGRPQYYVRFDSEAISRDVIRETVAALGKVSYVVVAGGDYRDFLAGNSVDAAFRELMSYVAREFVVADEFAGPAKDSLATRHIDGFVVFEKRSG